MPPPFNRLSAFFGRWGNQSGGNGNALPGPGDVGMPGSTTPKPSDQDPIFEIDLGGETTSDEAETEEIELGEPSEEDDDSDVFVSPDVRCQEILEFAQAILDPANSIPYVSWKNREKLAAELRTIAGAILAWFHERGGVTVFQIRALDQLEEKIESLRRLGGEGPVDGEGDY